jgi:hypothetical protein
MALRDTLENVLREYDSAKLTTFAAAIVVSSLRNFRSSLPARRPAAFTACRRPRQRAYRMARLERELYSLKADPSACSDNQNRTHRSSAAALLHWVTQ